MRLALANLLHDRTRLAVTVAGIAFSTFLMLFQGSLLLGFLRASSRVIESVDADLWIGSHGANSFDFATPLPANTRWMARGVPGVATVNQIVTGLGFWQRPDGSRQTVSVVGADRETGGDYPIGPATVMLREAAWIDSSDERNLAVSSSGLAGSGLPGIEISGHRVRVQKTINDFSTFLGTPYVFMALSDARRCIGAAPEQSMFLAIRVAPGRDPAQVRDALQQRVPGVDVWTVGDFAFRAKRYWTLQTGAGAALVTAGLLGFVVGVLVVSQTVYATTMEHIEEFATLKALGASSAQVAAMVVVQAIAGTVCGLVLGIIAAYPSMQAARPLIAWIYTPWQLTASIAVSALLMAGLASIAAARAALSVEPGRVFRA
jgi:putative ABC transport system permease protein